MESEKTPILKNKYFKFIAWSLFLLFVSVRLSNYLWLLVIPVVFDLFVTQKVLSNKIFKTGFWTIVYLLWVIWMGNYWLLIGLPVVFDLYYTKKVNWTFWKPRDPAKKTFIVEWVDAVIFAVFAASIIRMFLVEAYTIPTSSMEKTLLVGDYLFVSKFDYGPKLPNTPLSFPFVHHTLPLTKATPSYLEWIKMPYKRLAGLEKVKRNDIVVFNFPEGDTVCAGVQAASYYALARQYGRKAILEDKIFGDIIVRPVDKKENYIKRCVAVSGDKIQIKNTQLYVNGEKQILAPKEEMQYNYFIVTGGQAINERFVKNYDISLEDFQNAQRFFRSQEIVQYIKLNPDLSKYEMANIYLFPLTAEDVEKIKSNPFVKTVIRYIKPEDYCNTDVLPHDSTLAKWNEDNFGPIWIPKAGEKVQLTALNYAIYKRAIEVYEGNKVERKVNDIYINGKKTSSYTFKLNYYWMMGDNRHNSADSRFWGFVPEDHITGKAMMLWFSSDKDKSFPMNIRWKRMLTMIQ